jgi:hypothetical protein
MAIIDDVAKRVSGRTFMIGAAVAAVGLVTESAISWISRETPPAWAPVTISNVVLPDYFHTPPSISVQLKLTS